jgi:hypothetical protein
MIGMLAGMNGRVEEWVWVIQPWKSLAVFLYPRQCFNRLFQEVFETKIDV